MGTQALHGKVQRPFQMLVDAAFVPVGKGDDFIQKGGVSGFGDVFADRGKEPQRVVGPVCGMAGFLHIGSVFRRVLMAGIVGKFHQRQSAAVVHLSREHEADLLCRRLRFQMDDALDVLHRVPVAVAVPQAAVDEGGGTGPGEGNEAVIGVPGVDHGIEFRAGCLDLEAGEFSMPERFQGVQLRRADRRRVLVCVQQAGAFLCGLLSQQKGKRHGFFRFQRHRCGERAAAVAVVAQLVPQVPPLHANGIVITPIRPQKFRPVAAIRGNLRPGQTEKAFNHRLGVHLVLRSVQIAVNLLADAVSVKQRAGDELGVLQVHLVLLVIAMAGEFGVAGEGQGPGAVRVVAHRQPPDLMGSVQGHVVGRLAVDAAVIRLHDRIAHTVTADAFVCIQVLTHRLPGRRPEISRLTVPEVDVTPRLVELVEHVAQNPSVGSGFYEAVAPRVVGNQGPVLRRTQVVGPRRGGVGPSDDVLTGLMVKISVLHCFPSPYISSTVI